MDTCTYNYLEPSSLSGILKTVYLFLEGQRLRRTCKTLLEESSQLGFPNIKSAIANILVLKPSFAEIVKVTHADPKSAAVELKKNPPNTRADSQSPEKPKLKDSGKEATSRPTPNSKSRTTGTSADKSKHKDSGTPTRTASPTKIPVETVPQVYNEIKDIQIIHAVVEEEKVISPDRLRVDDNLEKSDVVTTIDGVIPMEDNCAVARGNMSRTILGGIQVIRASQTSVSPSANVKSSLNRVAIVDAENLKHLNSPTSHIINDIEYKDVAEGVGTSSNISSNALDYNKVKTDLTTADFSKRVLLLQALRWQLTKASPNERVAIVKEFKQQDILGLRNGEDPSPLTSCLYSEPPNSALQEEISRLVNALSSSSEGRNYLAEDDNILTITLPLVMELDCNCPEITQMVREHLLVSLQKLSLRNKMRLTMIENGLPIYLVYFLTQRHEHISDYCLEYSCALLMNLCLHDTARADLLGISFEVVNMLNVFVKSSHLHCLTYMNGLMYSLFCEEEIRNKAKDSELQKSLIAVMVAVHDEDIRLQMELILDILNGSAVPHNINSSNIGEDVEVDHFESEIDQGDAVQDTTNCDAILGQYRMVGGHEEASSSKHDTSSNTDTAKEFGQVLFEALNARLSMLVPQDPQKISPSTPKRPVGDKTRKKSPVARSPTPTKKIAPPTKKVPLIKTNRQPSISAKARQPSSSTERTCLASSRTEPIIRSSAAARGFQKSGYISPYCAKYQTSGRKYTCVCYDEMQNFIKNNCVGSCPGGTSQCKRDCSKPNADEDLFQSAIELLALNCCKSVVGQSVHVDCECYSTVFQSRPKVMRTP